MKKSRWICLVLCVLLGAVGLFAACSNDRDGSSDYAVTLSKTTLALTVGDSSNLTATITKGGEKVTATPTWASSDKSVVTVENGKVTAIKAGTATVTASYEGASASCAVTVSESDLTLQLSKTAVTLYEGETETLTVTASDGKTYAYEWESSDESVATVANGVITAVSEGTATVTVSHGSAKAECAVTVEQEEVFLLLSQSSVNLKVNGTATVTAAATDGSAVTVQWESSDESVATVANGVITALKAGTTTVKASAGADLTATCSVTVSDDYVLIFPEISGNLFVGEAYDLQIVLRRNGTDENISEATVTGNGFTREGAVITPTQSGKMQISVSYHGETVTRTAAAYIKVSTKAELEAIGTDATTLAQNYMLTQNIDMQGGTFKTIGHYNVGGDGEKPFTGILDGNGFSVMNFTPVRGDTGLPAANSALIGSVGTTGVVRNLSVINVTLNGRIAGGLASWVKGTIHNCFVDVTINYAAGADNNNPMGGVASKVYNTADISNVVAVVRLGPDVATADLVTVGAFAGFYVSTGKYSNLYSISPASIGFTETSVVTGTTNAVTNKTAPAGCADYNSIADFNEAVDGTGFTGWSFADGLYPHFTGMPAEQIDFTCENSMYTNTTLDITYTSKYNAVELSLNDTYEGVTLENGVLTVASTATADSIVVNAKSLYFGTREQRTITVLANAYTIDITKKQYAFTWIKNRSEAAAYSEELVFSIQHNGEAYTGEITYESANPGIATAANKVLTAVGDGTTTVKIKVGDVELDTLSVTSTMYNPVSSQTELEAIGASATAMAQKYMLMQDLDLGGAAIASFSSWQTKDTKTFKGIFDGNGHTISNFTPTNRASGDNDVGLFGYIAGGTIRNVSFMNVKTSNRSAVVASFVLSGTVENVYVDVQYMGNPANVNENNPAAGIIGKLSSGGTIQKCVTRITFADAKPQYFGGIASQNNGGTIRNCYVITDRELPVYATTDTTSTTVKPGPVENSTVYTSLAAFNDAVDGTGFTGWTFAAGLYPHLTAMAAEEVDFTCANEVYAGNTLNITYTSKYAVTLALNDTYEGVTLQNGVLLVGASVTADTQIVVRAQSLYFNYNEQFTVTVKANAYSIKMTKTKYTFTWVKDYEAAADYTETLVYNVTQNGETYNGEVVFTSSNENVAKVVGDVLTATGDGTATITVSVGGIDLETLTITSNMYNAVSSKEELEAIGANNTSVTKKYMLINDIDIGGAVFETIAHYADSRVFTGILDGNGYSVKNFIPGHNGVQDGDRNTEATRNCGFIGQLGESGIVRNLSLIGVTLKGGITGGIATICKGTIENCYIEVTIDQYYNVNNPNAGVTSKLYASATITNTIAVVSLGSNATQLISVAAFAGWYQSGVTMSNCYSISPASIGFTETGTTSNGLTNSTPAGCADYDTTDAFFGGANLEDFDSTVWAFDTTNKTIALKNNVHGIIKQ